MKSKRGIKMRETYIFLNLTRPSDQNKKLASLSYRLMGKKGDFLLVEKWQIDVWLFSNSPFPFVASTSHEL